MPVPAVLLGRLARDRRYKGQGLGELLLMHALWRSQKIAESLGVYAVEVDAIDEKASAFYQSYGFTSLFDNPRHLYLSMTTIRQLNLEFSD